MVSSKPDDSDPTQVCRDELPWEYIMTTHSTFTDFPTMLHPSISQLSLKAYQVLTPEGTKWHHHFSENPWSHWREKHSDYKIAHNAQLCTRHSKWMIKTMCALGGQRRAQPRWAAPQAQTAPRTGGLHEAKYKRLPRKNSRERRVGYWKGKPQGSRLAWGGAQPHADTVRRQSSLGHAWPSGTVRDPAPKPGTPESLSNRPWIASAGENGICNPENDMYQLFWVKLYLSLFTPWFPHTLNFAFKMTAPAMSRSQHI